MFLLPFCQLVCTVCILMSSLPILQCVCTQICLGNKIGGILSVWEYSGKWGGGKCFDPPPLFSPPTPIHLRPHYFFHPQPLSFVGFFSLILWHLLVNIFLWHSISNFNGCFSSFFLSSAYHFLLECCTVRRLSIKEIVTWDPSLACPLGGGERYRLASAMIFRRPVYESSESSHIG